MDKNSLPPDIQIPPINWKSFLGWFFGTAFVIIFGVIQALPAIIPDEAASWLKNYGLGFVLAVLVLMGIVFSVPYLFPTLRAIYQRARRYSSLHQVAQTMLGAAETKYTDLEKERDSKIQQVTETLTSRIHEMDKQLELRTVQLVTAKREIVSQWLQNKHAVRLRLLSQRYTQDALFITIEKLDAPILEKGKRVIIMDTIDGMLMGYFEIEQVQRDKYLAKGVDSVDELWLGEAMQEGATDIVPSMEAVYIPEDENNESR